MNYSKSAILLALLFVTLGCKSFVEDININPNGFTDISTTLLVNHAVLNVASIQESDAARTAGMWTDQFSGEDRSYRSRDSYAIDDSDFDEIWARFFRDGLAPARGAKAKAIAEGATGLEGIATILEGYYAAEAALLFGDVPFSEADDVTNFPDPRYDSQQDVISEAITLLAQGAELTSDLQVTSGNSVLTGEASWAELAKALEARYRISTRDYAGALEAAEASFKSITDVPSIVHSTDNFAENLFYQFEAEQRSDYLTFERSYLLRVISDGTFVSRTSTKTNDTSRRNFYTYNAGGFDRINTNDNGLFAAGADFPIVSYPELQLIIAEAAFRTGDLSKAIQALNKARNYWDFILGVDDYLDLEASDFAGSTDLLNAIMLEKFVSVFGLPTFYDIARTDNLVGTDLDGRVTPVQRFLYPSVERSSNANYPGLKTLDDPTPINR